MQLSHCREAASSSTTQKLHTNFMEPDDSLPCSQEPDAGSYPEPDESSPYHPHSVFLRLIVILSSHLHLGFLSNFFPCDFPTKTLYAFLSFPCVLYALKSYPHWYITILSTQINPQHCINILEIAHFLRLLLKCLYFYSTFSVLWYV
jgi:hypothetical protein